MTIVNSTFTHNRAKGNGTTIFNNGGTIVLKNTILSTDNKFEIKCAGSQITDGGGNLQWPSNDSSCVGAFGDPKLAILAIDGGLTPTLGLLPGSAAIDAGINGTCASEPVNNLSQNGIIRPHGPKCDIGAYELDYLVVNDITRLDPNPTYAENVRFLVTFSKPVTGVDLKDFSLTTTQISAASITSITGSGTAYTVNVNTGINSGTLRLNVVDDDSIIDGAHNPLGGEGATNGDFFSGETYTIKEPPIFGDVPLTHSAYSSIEWIYNSGITIGCSTDPLLYCPTQPVTRAQMAIFLLRAKYGASFKPDDVPPTGTGFFDVNPADQAAPWITQFYAEGITSGCDAGKYCPTQPITRAQMAVFLLRTKFGADHQPEPVPDTGTGFGDVDPGHPVATWIIELSNTGITKGCQTDPPQYCPNQSVTRAEMAIFLMRAFLIP